MYSINISKKKTLNYEYRNHTISSKDLKKNLSSNYFVKISNSRYEL